MMIRSLLLDTGEGETGTSGAAGAPSGQLTEPDKANQVAPAPAAATVIAQAKITEETLLLRQEKAELEAKLKTRETEIAAARDEHERYKKTVETPQPVPVKTTPVPKPRPLGFC